MCFKEDYQNTRANVKGQPFAIISNQYDFLNSVIPKTTRDLSRFYDD